jgi:hypothetical protein
MSVEAMAIVLHHSQAKGTARLVLVGIANHDGDGGAWPSIATLARYTGTSERRVQQTLRELEMAGEITVVRQGGGLAATAHHQRTNLYTINVRCPDDCDGTRNHGVKKDAPGEAEFTGRVKPVAPGRVKPVAPEPSLEPSLNLQPPPSAAARTRSAEPRGTRLPDPFPLTDDLKAWARTDCPNVGPTDHEQFLDYWRAVPGAKGRKIDWPATWKRWMREEQKRRSSPGRNGRPQPDRNTPLTTRGMTDTELRDYALNPHIYPRPPRRTG